MTDKNAMSFAVIIAALLISSSVFYLGYSLNKNKNTSSAEANTVAKTNAAKPVAQAPLNAPENGGVVKISIDDDPVLGDANASVTMVEFSDFECPFCARHSVLTNPQIVSEYVDTNKLKIVYRDTPFHGESAIAKSNAANCVYDQLGSVGFFEVKDGIYQVLNKDQRNITADEIKALAIKAGVNESEYNACVTENKFASEINKDLSDSRVYGVQGTPAFFIGKTTESGEIDGELISGAQPYAVFKQVIDSYLE